MIIAKQLRTDGFCVLPTAPYAPDLLKHLKSGKSYAGHVKTKPRNDLSCYALERILSFPGPLALALSLTDDIEEYLGQEPALYSMNAVRSVPTDTPLPSVQDFHRDYDDSAFVALFTYLTPVLSDDDGPHQLRNSDGTSVFYGQTGMTWLENPGLDHRGLPPRSGERVILWTRWGVSPRPKSYDKDGTVPVPSHLVVDYPSDPRLQRIIRLIAC